MRKITEETKEEIRNLVYDFFADECEVEVEEINDDTSVNDDLDGDSLMFVEMVEILKKKYNLAIQMQSIGKYLLKNPAKTIGEIIDTCYLVYEKEDNIINE